MIAYGISKTASGLVKDTVRFKKAEKDGLDRRLDRLFTGRLTAFPVMLLLLAGIFWLTVSGANVPSELLGEFLFGLEDDIFAALSRLGVGDTAADFIVNRTVARSGLGNFRYASAHGDIFSPVYHIGGFRLSSPGGLQS